MTRRSLAVALLCLATAAYARDADRVVVVRNAASPISCAVADDYARRREVRQAVTVRCPDAATAASRETFSYADYVKTLEQPLRAYLAAHPLVDFIVLTKGIPLRIADAPDLRGGEARMSLDSRLAALGYDQRPDTVKVLLTDGAWNGTAWANRFWNGGTHFSHARYGGYLVTRLDGYTAADAMALTTRALAAERTPPAGTILLDACPAFGYGDAQKQPLRLALGATAADARELRIVGEAPYRDYNADMQHARRVLAARRVPVELTAGPAFAGDRSGLLGYVSWGSNDARYAAAAYHSLRFAPGAVGETAVSTSARTFLPTTGGQSLIADLIAQGITGVKGYTDEPLLQAVASPTILFDRYTRGWTLAESMYAASRFVGWQDVVIGDPLCRPYRHGGRYTSGP